MQKKKYVFYLPGLRSLDMINASLRIMLSISDVNNTEAKVMYSFCEQERYCIRTILTAGYEMQVVEFGVRLSVHLYLELSLGVS